MLLYKKDIMMNTIDDQYFQAIKDKNIKLLEKLVEEQARKNGYIIKVYHGTDKNFNIFKSFIGSTIWFSEDKEKIIKGESGANAFNKIIPVYLKVNKTAGWSEYEKLGIGQIMDRGFDSIKLDDDWVVFNPNQIKSAELIIKKNGKIIPLSERFNSNSKYYKENKMKTFKEYLLENISNNNKYFDILETIDAKKINPIKGAVFLPLVKNIVKYGKSDEIFHNY
jgi:hypothetical protein